MPQITEEAIYSALGVQPEQPAAGEKPQEIAAPAPEEQEVPAAEGEKEQEPAVPAAAEEETKTGEEGAPGDPAPETETEPKQQTPEERRANAARRRQQEQQAAIDQAVQAALEKERSESAAAMEGFFQRAGLKNTFTGEPIKTMEEFQAWDEKFRAQRLQQELQAGKLTPEALADAIGAHPAVKQAQELIQRNAETQRQQQEAAARAQVDAEIEKIRKLDPNIQNVKDLLNMPNSKEFYDLVKRGYKLSDAHYIVNRERLEQAQAEAIRAQAVVAAQSKSHLVPTGNSRGSGAVDVPKEEMQLYRMLNPHMSDAEIHAHYNKYRSGK